MILPPLPTCLPPPLLYVLRLLHYCLYVHLSLLLRLAFITCCVLLHRLDLLVCYREFVGDSLQQRHNGHRFSTFDNDKDIDASNCAERFKGGWWYTNCHDSNLNTLYLGGPHASQADGINWKTWRGHYYSLKFTEMKIRP